MTPEEKKEIARRNGARSKGPVSAEGKRHSSRNAIQYGEYAKTLKFFVPPHDACADRESRQCFYNLLDSLVEHYRPVNEVGYNIVREIGVATWQIQRLTSTQTVLFNRESARLNGTPLPNADPGVQTAAVAESLFGDVFVTPRLTRELDRLHRRVGQLERRFVYNRSRFGDATKRVVKFARIERREAQNEVERTKLFSPQTIENNQNRPKNEKIDLAA